MDVNKTLGERIRQARQEKDGGKTLAEIADRCDFSVSYLSQLERDKVEPSLSSLKKIADVLDVSAVSLMFDETRERQSAQVVRKGERKSVDLPGGNLHYEMLIPDLQGRLSVLKLEAPPGADSGSEPMQHRGEDVAVVLEGSLLYTVDGEEHQLEAGDSIRYNSRLPHRMENPHDEESRAIVITTPPSF